MKIGFASYLSPELNKHSSAINLFGTKLNEFVVGKDCGKDILEIYIGIICVNPQFEQFFKFRRPKYDRTEKITEKEGVKYRVFRTFQYDIKIDFETFKNANEDEVSNLLAKEILYSLRVFDEMNLKIKDFDLIRFKEDLTCFFRGKKLI